MKLKAFVPKDWKKQWKKNGNIVITRPKLLDSDKEVKVEIKEAKDA